MELNTVENLIATLLTLSFPPLGSNIPQIYVTWHNHGLFHWGFVCTPVEKKIESKTLVFLKTKYKFICLLSTLEIIQSWVTLERTIHGRMSLPDWF